jgi:hypothetical protein
VAGPEAGGTPGARVDRDSRRGAPILRGTQVVLRPVVDTDIPALEAILREPEMSR